MGNQQNGYCTPDDAQKANLVFLFPERHKIAGQEKRNVGRNKYRKYSPPLINPHEGMIGGTGQK